MQPAPDPRASPSHRALPLPRFVAQVRSQLQRVAEWPESELPLDEKVAYLQEVRHTFGRSALLLSGGGGLGAFHIVSAVMLPYATKPALWCEVCRQCCCLLFPVPLLLSCSVTVMMNTLLLAHSSGSSQRPAYQPVVSRLAVFTAA